MVALQQRLADLAAAVGADIKAIRSAYKGQWVTTTTYARGDIVNALAIAWICLVSSSTNEWPFSNWGTKWAPLVTGFNWMGAFKTSNGGVYYDYNVGDVVSYQGGTYLCTTYSTYLAAWDPAKWALMAAPGVDGATGAAGAGVATGGTTGQVLKKNTGTNYDTGWVSLAASLVANTPAGNIAATDVQAALNELDTEKAVKATNTVITASGSYTIPTGAKLLVMRAVGGGGGGGAGARGATATARCAGGGGGGGAGSDLTIDATLLTSPLTITIGAAGTAAAAQTVDTTAGATGGNGGQTLVADSVIGSLLKANGGLGGGGGGIAVAGAGGAGGVGPVGGGAGAASSASGSGGGTSSSGNGAAGGGSGGGLNTSNVASAGGAGAPTAASGAAVGTGGASLVAGGAGAGVAGIARGGPGGGGSGSGSAAAAALAGGAGGLYGGGGGGGGGSLNGFNSGAGGAGAAGVVQITAYF